MFGFRQLFASGNYGIYDGLDRGLKNNRISQKYWEPLDVSCLFFPTYKQRNICWPKELENKTYNDFVGHIMVESQMQRMSGIMKRNVLTRRKKTKHGFFLSLLLDPSYKRENSEKMLLITSYMHVPRGIVGQL